MNSKIAIVENILSANDRIAEQNRTTFDEVGVFAVNIMASPGAGKTSTIIRTFEELGGELHLGVVQGDLASSLDAEKVRAFGIPAVQINTGGGCHLDAVMLQNALAQIPLDDVDVLLVENVGNLVCPANFNLGTHKSVLVASLPEGDDKPYKYPGMYRGIDVLLINKIDLKPYLDFDMEYFTRGAQILNPGLVCFSISCKTGEGFPEWIAWLKKQVSDAQG